MVAPTIWLALIFLEWMWQANKRVALLAIAFVVASVVWNITSIADYLLHPQYTSCRCQCRDQAGIAAEHNIEPFAAGIADWPWGR